MNLDTTIIIILLALNIFFIGSSIKMSRESKRMKESLKIARMRIRLQQQVNEEGGKPIPPSNRRINETQ